MKKSIVVEVFGGPEQLKLIEEENLPLPEKSVRIAIKAIGVNRADILLRTGAYHSAKLPVRPGVEASGIVTESTSTNFPIGSRVLIFANRTGLYTSETISSETQICLIPDSITFEQATAIPINWLTAWYCINNLIKLQAGESIFIPAAASGVGYAAIQISKYLEANIIAGASTKEKLDLAKQLGAKHIINYSEQNLTEEILKITDGKGIDTFLDTVGGKIFSQGLKALGQFGRVAALANVTLEDSLINTRDFYPKNAAIFGFQYGNLLTSGRYNPTEDITKILELVANKTFSVHIAEKFPLQNAAQAHQVLESRQVIGKLILIP